MPIDAHVEMLCDCSPYFDRIFHDRFEKTISEAVRFPDDDPDIFAEFISWAYGEDPFVGQPVKTIRIFQLWVLAAKFEIPRLQDTAIMLTAKMFDKTPHVIIAPEAVNYVYNNTIIDSPLRRMIVDIWTHNAMQGAFLRHKDVLPRLFLVDLCCAWAEINESKYIGVGHFDFEAYFVQSPALGKQDSQDVPIANSSNVLDTPQLATPHQLANRAMKIPSSRLRNHSSASPSQGTATPASSTANVDKNCEVSREMEDLNI